MFYKNVVLNSFTNFTGTNLCQSLFFNKVAGPDVCDFIKKFSLTQVFSYEFCEIFKNILCAEHLWTSGSHNCRHFLKKSFLAFVKDYLSAGHRNTFRT